MPDWISRQLVLQGLHPWWAAVIHVSAVLAAAGLIVLLHRDERRLVSPAAGRWLLGLRLSVLALVLLTVLQPVLSWTINTESAGRIVVGIDRSQSMRLTDPQAARGEKLHWARGLGMIGNADWQDRLDAWQQAFDQDQEPVWTTEAEAPEDVDRARMSEIRAANLRGVFEELNSLSREEMARRLLLETPNPLLTQLQKMAVVETFAFGGRTEPCEFVAGSEQLSEASAALQPELTDLGAALRTGPATSAAPILGIILLTDGRHTGAVSPVAAAQALGNLGTPVFPVLLGSTHRPKDLAIPTLDAPATVYRGDKPLVKAMLQTSGFEGTDVVVEWKRIDGENQTPLETRTLHPTGPLTALEFELPAADVGRRTYLVSFPVQAGETDLENNSRSFTVAVVDDRAKVLLVDDEARWEFRYLETALARDDRVDLRAVLFRQPYLKLLPENFFARTLPAESPSPFENLDVVILGDVAPWQVTEEHWTQLENFVSERGGTLVLSAGKKFLPSAYQSPILDRLSPMAALQRRNLADASAQVAPGQRGWRLELSPEGAAQPMFRFDDDAATNRTVWSNLPGPLWAWLGTAKPAATVWVTAVAPQLPGTEDSLDQVLIAHQNYGFGQVVWIGFDATWRWRFRNGDEYHHQFWGQLVRWAARNKIAAGNEFVRFGAEKSDVAAGENVVLRTRWSPQFLERFPQVTAQAEVFKAGQAARDPVATVDLAVRAGQSLIRDGRAINLPPGDYRAKLTVRDADLGPTSVDTTFTVRPPETPELVNTTANRELLSQLADASGGRLLFADELDQLPALLRRENVSEAAYRETPLWDHGLMLVVFFSLLTTEWVLRKWHGLP